MHSADGGSEFRQAKRVLESDLHISSTQHIGHDVVGRRDSAPDAADRHLVGNATLGGELHGKATSVQPSDFFFLVRSRERNSLGCCGWNKKCVVWLLIKGKV